jgi:hypothetical protein
MPKYVLITNEKVEILGAINDLYVNYRIINMNKYMRILEVHLAAYFENSQELAFNLEHRLLSDYLYKTLKRNVQSLFGKIVIDLMPENEYEKHFRSMNTKYVADFNSGILEIMLPFSLEIYLTKDTKARKHWVREVLIREISELPPEFGVDITRALEYLDRGLKETSYVDKD